MDRLIPMNRRTSGLTWLEIAVGLAVLGILFVFLFPRVRSRALSEHLPASVIAYSMGKDGKIGGRGHPDRLRKERSRERPEDIPSWE